LAMSGSSSLTLSPLSSSHSSSFSTATGF
jgi:hypothetical protein